MWKRMRNGIMKAPFVFFCSCPLFCSLRCWFTSTYEYRRKVETGVEVMVTVMEDGWFFAAVVCP
jgi:hypothetical protein